MKKPYSKPELYEYGTITELTEARGGQGHHYGWEKKDWEQKQEYIGGGS
jgi:hypothetical protein